MLNRRPGGSAFCWLSLLHLITNWSGPQIHRGFREPLRLSLGFLYHFLSPTRLISNSSDLQLSRGPSAGRWLSLPHLVSDFSGPQLSDFLSSPSYIIVQSPTQSPAQSLEWHVCSSSSGNNCHAVHRSLSSGASVYEYIMGFFYLVPFRQPNQPMQFHSITGYWNMSLPSGASLWKWHVWPGRRSIYTNHIIVVTKDGQLKHTYCSYEMIRDVNLKTCQSRWMIGRRGERGSGISVLAVRHDDDDENSIDPGT